MVLTVSFVLSLVTGLVCHHRRRSLPRQLDASVGASGPHDFSVRFSTVRYRRFHVHRILTRVRDDREPPLCGTGRLEYKGDLGFRKNRIFLQRGLDRKTGEAQSTALICPSGNGGGAGGFRFSQATRAFEDFPPYGLRKLAKRPSPA